MKRLLIIAMMILGGSVTMMAQSGQRPWQKQIALDVGAQFPSGDYGSRLDMAIGYSATFYYQLFTRNTFVSLGVGSHNFAINGSSTTYNVLPILIGGKYNFTLTGFQPYVGLELGPYLTSSSAGSASDLEIGIMPKAGFRYPLAAGFDFDASLKYNAVITSDLGFNYLGINAGVAYTIE